MDIEIGQKFIKNKEFAKALDFFLNISNIKGNHPTINFYLGLIYSELNDFKKSTEYYEKSLENNPSSFYTLYNLAIVKQNIGETRKAKEIYLELIKIDKFKIRPYLGLYTLNPEFINDIHYKNILKIEKKLNITKYEKSLIAFILSKREKKKKNFKKEIEYLNNFHNLCFNSNHQYNLQSEFYYKKIINIFYNKIKFNNYDISDRFLKNFSPIFIVGLPRSGSTLVESILTSSEENIPSFRESAFINMGLITQLSSYLLSDKENFEKFDFNVEEFENFIHKKYTQFSIINKNTNFFVDKSLENFFNIEFILNIFPKAKFIHTHRNLKDAIIAIFQSLLPKLSWTHSIDDIIAYAENYQKIIKYFKKKYPEKIIDMSLEDLRLNKERVTKEIFKFCNLSWKP